MQEQVISFVQNHWVLSSAFGVLSIIALLNEYVSQRHGPKRLSTTAAVEQMNHHSALVIDLRPTEAFRSGHIVGAISIPSTEPDQLKQYQATPLILVCARGIQSNALANRLRKQGFSAVMVLDGGVNAWQLANLPLIKHKKS